MLTLIQKRHLRAYTCPACGNPIGRIHCYPVTAETLISRLTDTVPMHPTCAKAAGSIIWTVKTSSPATPSGRLFERSEADWFIHLHSPCFIDFYLPDGAQPSYEQIRELMLPAIRTAAAAAQSEEETDEIARAIAALHPFLPKKPKTQTPQ